MMDQHIKWAWEKCQDDVREELKSVEKDDGDYDITYQGLAELIFRHLSNPGGDLIDWEINLVDVKGGGDTWGSLLFIAKVKNYSNWVITAVSYGSCYCCDALMAANTPSDLFRLCLTMVQKAVILPPLHPSMPKGLSSEQPDY